MAASPSSSARLTYLPTVTGENFRPRAMARALNPASLSSGAQTSCTVPVRSANVISTRIWACGRVSALWVKRLVSAGARAASAGGVVDSVWLGMMED